MTKKHSKKHKVKEKELKKMFQMWLDTDMVKSGYNFHIVERQNEAFARGWRFAMKNVIDKLEERGF